MAGLARSRRGFPLLLLPRAGYWIEYIRALPRRAAPLREIPRRDAAPHKSCAALESLKKAWPDARARRLIRPAMNDRDYRRARASAVAAAKGKERSSLNCYSRPRRCDISSSLFCVRGRPRFGLRTKRLCCAPVLSLVLLSRRAPPRSRPSRAAAAAAAPKPPALASPKWIRALH